MYKSKALVTIFLLYFFLSFTSFSHAALWDDIVKNIQGIAGGTTGSLSLNSSISLAPEGDANKNGQIDSGDTIRFSYTINNPTTKEISFATLKTKIPRNYLNFIHNIEGTMNLSDKNNTIIIPNLRINPGQNLEVKFDARVNYFSDSDKTIFTEPEIVTSDNKPFLKSVKKEIKAKFRKDKFPSNLDVKHK